MLPLSLETLVFEEEENKIKFEELYRSYRQLMFFVANGILKDEYLAEDAVHQSFLRIFENIAKISDVKCPQTKGYVVIICRNTSLNMLRSKKRKAAESLDEIAGYTCLPDDARQAVDEQVEEKDGYRALVLAIRSLPDKYSSVLLLKYVHGFSNQEIAESLGLTAENVKKLIQRARKKLEGILQGKEEAGR